jgi:DNA-directed RNA polymerase specialized sigma24 family protein
LWPIEVEEGNVVTLALPAANLDPDFCRPQPGLVARAKEGDPRAFLGLFEAHGSRVYSLGLQFLGNIPAAENLTRDIFIEAFGSLNCISDDAAFAACLYRNAAKSVLVSYLKGRSHGDSGHRVRPHRHQSLVGQE